MLCFYLWAIFGVYALMGAVFTLTGIAALVLGVGMTVDANIISYERIKQELYKGRSVRSAIAEGQKLSFTAILDAQITTLIAGLIMYIWGNGSVKGFATMLITSVVMTLALNVAFSRWLLRLVAESGICDNHPEYFGVKPSQIPNVNKGENQFYFGIKKIDFIGKSKYNITAAIAILVIALGIGIFNSTNGNGFMNLGIDFSSGTKLTITSDEAITISEVQSEMETLGYTNFSYQASGENMVYATTKEALTSDDLKTIKAEFLEKYGQEPGDNVVTSIVGKELVQNAIILTVVAWIAMLAYVSFRFKWDYALSCLVALVHDVLITLCAFVILRREVNTEVISVLLTIIGYSINNTIVVFDRVRETLNQRKALPNKEGYREIVSSSLAQTFYMSIYSSITTVLPLIFLLFMGAQSIFTFTLAMFIGMLSGTLSSIFIAPTLWYYIRTHYTPKQKKKKLEKKEVLDEYTIKGINA